MNPQYIKIDEFGNKFYFSNKTMTIQHREDGPAVEYVNGSTIWYLNDNLHRDGGPAAEYQDGSKFWFRNGQRHREDGPAVEWSTGKQSWYINDQPLTEVQFNKWRNSKSPCNGKKVTVDGIEYTLKA